MMHIPHSDLPTPERTSAARPRTGASRRLKLMTGIAGRALALSAGGALVACGTAETTSGYEAVSYAGPDPFTDPVGTDQPGTVPAAGAGGEQAGDRGGLYAQNPDQPVCDAAALVAQLQEDPAKAAAWAQVLGIIATDIPEFADSLTPVVLRADTAVTNHSFRDGTFVASPAVLAPGTAVFINSYGEPTVKCYSGNPLTRGEAAAGQAVTVVTPSSQIITRHVFLDLGTGGAVTAPGKPDTKPVPGPNPGPAPHPGPPKTKPDPRIAQAKELRTAADAAKAKAFDAAAKLGELDTLVKDKQAEYSRVFQDWVLFQDHANKLRALANTPPPSKEKTDAADAAKARADQALADSRRVSKEWSQARKDRGQAQKTADTAAAEAKKADTVATEAEEDLKKNPPKPVPAVAPQKVTDPATAVEPDEPSDARLATEPDTATNPDTATDSETAAGPDTAIDPATPIDPGTATEDTPVEPGTATEPGTPVEPAGEGTSGANR